jgi:hypothetical protein
MFVFAWPWQGALEKKLLGAGSDVYLKTEEVKALPKKTKKRYRAFS